ncbi:MAG TPA: TadE/TadG family type IV pilus assembly protein [Streptosporangiaceae bacterium]|nr:TadE/TadG family type IV pilus assembly protein [Streptosporangiaceae bacterium]
MRDLIIGLARPVLRLLGRDDRGAVGVLVAILIGGGVLFGMGAMVVDVGQLYSERAQLQNGADAGALAVAKTCAQGTCTPGTAQNYANKNSADGTSAVDLVCGSGGLGACPASTGKIYDCPPAPKPGTNYVDVHTGTLTASGSTLLPPTFARTLLGRTNYNGSTVFACAQAAWGPPLAASGIAVTFSACEWDQATQNGTLFAPPPPYPPNPLPAPSFDRVLKLHTTSTSGGCPTEPAGADGPGLFGWTDDPNSNCTTPIINGTFGGNTGVSASQACKTVLAADQANRTLVFLPIYIAVSGTGANGVYTLKGFAAFVITGYHLPGFTAKDWLNPANDCKGSNKCINGYFTQGLVPNPGSIGGPNLGADIIALTG